MNLTPTELERITIFNVAEIARKYRKNKIKLSLPEAQALIADEILLAARKGVSHPDLVSFGANILGPQEVQDGVCHMLRSVSVEVSMKEGTKLVTVFDPIESPDAKKIPGELFLASGDIEINVARKKIQLTILNTGDRTIQVRSHAHFFEVNKALQFDRKAAFGMRLNRPSGSGERFDPGVEKIVSLVSVGGQKRIHGFAGMTEGSVDNDQVKKDAFNKAKVQGFL